MAEPPILQLPEVDPTHLAVVIRGMLAEDLAQAERLRAGAAQSIARPNEETTGRFLALLEIAYLVAAADGFDDDEREGLLRLFGQLTDEVLDRETLEHHFGELDEGVKASGRGERLASAARDLVEEDRTHAIGFAAAIAMSDGWLGDAELAALIELGGHLSITRENAREQVEQVIQRVENRLR
jgi:tellurite resistance protein